MWFIQSQTVIRCLNWALPGGHAGNRNSSPFRLGIQTQVEGEKETDRQVELTVRRALSGRCLALHSLLVLTAKVS